MIAVAEPIDADQLRLRHEFLAMPALVLTTEQVARLLHIGVRHAAELLASLAADGFVTRTPCGAFRRVEPPMM